MSGLLYQGPPRGILSEPEPQGLLGALYQNPLMAQKFAKQREFMAPPTSVTDPRWEEHAKRQQQADHFLVAADLLGAAAPFAKPLGLLAGRMAGPAVEGYMARNGLLQSAVPYNKAVEKLPVRKEYQEGDLVPMANGETVRFSYAANGGKRFVAIGKTRNGKNFAKYYKWEDIKSD